MQLAANLAVTLDDVKVEPRAGLLVVWALNSCACVCCLYLRVGRCGGEN